MKKLCKSLLILTLILLTGCSFKGSMGQPIDETKNDSQLKQEVDKFVESNNNLEEKSEEYQNAINEVINNIKTEESENINE